MEGKKEKCQGEPTKSNAPLPFSPLVNPQPTLSIHASLMLAPRFADLRYRINSRRTELLPGSPCAFLLEPLGPFALLAKVLSEIRYTVTSRRPGRQETRSN